MYWIVLRFDGALVGQMSADVSEVTGGVRLATRQTCSVAAVVVIVASAFDCAVEAVSEVAGFTEDLRSVAATLGVFWVVTGGASFDCHDAILFDNSSKGSAVWS
jgi:hypothetical protein